MCCWSQFRNAAYLRHSAASKYSFEDSQAASNDHIVADVLHNASGLTGHQGEQDRGCGVVYYAVSVRFQKQLSHG